MTDKKTETPKKPDPVEALEKRVKKLEEAAKANGWSSHA